MSLGRTAISLAPPMKNLEAELFIRVTLKMTHSVPGYLPKMLMAVGLQVPLPQIRLEHKP